MINFWENAFYFSSVKNFLCFLLDTDNYITKKTFWIAENVQEVKDGYYCCPCGKVIHAKSNLNRHVRDMHLEKNIGYECPTCKSIHGSKNLFQHHIYSKHPGMRGINLSKFAYYKEWFKIWNKMQFYQKVSHSSSPLLPSRLFILDRR